MLLPTPFQNVSEQASRLVDVNRIRVKARKVFIGHPSWPLRLNSQLGKALGDLGCSSGKNDRPTPPLSVVIQDKKFGLHGLISLHCNSVATTVLA